MFRVRQASLIAAGDRWLSSGVWREGKGVFYYECTIVFPHHLYSQYIYLCNFMSCHSHTLSIQTRVTVSLLCLLANKLIWSFFKCFRTSRPGSVCSTYHFLNCSTRTWSSSPLSHTPPAPDLASMWVPLEHRVSTVGFVSDFFFFFECIFHF